VNVTLAAPAAAAVTEGGGDEGSPDGCGEDDSDEESEGSDADADQSCTGNDGDDPPDWATGLLIALAALGAGGIGVAAAQRGGKEANVAESWEDIARGEYSKPEEPISARASDLTKIGAPVAAFITAVLAAVGGWVSDAPPEQAVIAVAVVVAVAVGGLMFVFATDFRARAAVQVARLETLARHTSDETAANNAVQEKARGEIAEAKAAADQKSADADAAKELADKAQTRADEARRREETSIAEANKRVLAAEDEIAALQIELAEAREQHAVDTDESGRPARDRPSRRSYLSIERLTARFNGEQTEIYGVESQAGRVLRYLIRTPGGMSWVPAAGVDEIGGPSNH
jgi:hypothetical protein